MDTSLDNTRKTWFRDWLSRAWPRVHSLVFNNKAWVELLPAINALGIFTAIVGFILALANQKNRGKYLFYVNDVGHLLILFAVLFCFLTRLGIKRPEYQTEDNFVSRTVGTFKIWLIFLTISWLIFYFCRTFADIPQAFCAPTGCPSDFFNSLANKAQASSHYVNILSALAFFGLYLTAEFAGASRLSVRERVGATIGVILLAAPFQIIADVVKTHPLHEELNLLAGIINGLIVGIATALLIGRLDSKYIGLSTAVITVLYCYALIQPLFPLVFQDEKIIQESPLVYMQYTLVAMALVMKIILLCSIGKIIDTGTLHFYVSSMCWIEKHAATLRVLHEKARTSDSSTGGGPPLFSLVPPDNDKAKVYFATSDIYVQLGILNAWLGVSWRIKKIIIEKIQIATTEFKVRDVEVKDNDSAVYISENNRFTRINLQIRLEVESDLFKAQLKRDPTIQLTKQNQKPKSVDVVLMGLKADTSLLEEERGIHPVRHFLESVDLRNQLFYKATLEVKDLK